MRVKVLQRALNAHKRKVGGGEGREDLLPATVLSVSHSSDLCRASSWRSSAALSFMGNVEAASTSYARQPRSVT